MTRNPKSFAWLSFGLLSAALLYGLVALPTVPLAGGQSVFSHADHDQVNQGLQTDADDTDAGEGLVSTYAGVDWVVGVLVLDDGSFISQATGITWIDLAITAELTLNGSPVLGDNGEPVIFPSSGTQIQFISGDEQYPNTEFPTPLYANPGANGDVIVLTSDTNATVNEYNSNGAGPANLTGTWYIYDIFEFVDTGALKLVENFAPATNQTGSWTSGLLPSFYLPSPPGKLVVGVSFDYDEADGVRNARTAHPGGPGKFGPVQALRFLGKVSDRVIFSVGPGEGEDCKPSELQVRGVPSTHGADYDGPTTVDLVVGQGRVLRTATVEAPTAVVDRQEFGPATAFAIAATGAGSHAVSFHAETVCPSGGADEVFDESYRQWTAHKCDLPTAAAAEYKYILGVFDVAPLIPGELYDNSTVEENDTYLNISAVHFPAQELPAFLRETDADGNVGFCEENGVMQTMATYPSDPYRVSGSVEIQYALSKIHAYEAWDRGYGDAAAVTVCVVDSGYAMDHEDLPPGSGPPSRYLALDDYNYLQPSAQPADDNGHGSHVAGIISAVTDNNVGISGLAQVGIVAMKVVNQAGFANEYHVAAAIGRCHQVGAKIVNLSLGYDPATLTLKKSRALELAVNRAATDAVLVGAAGNGPPMRTPAALDNVIAVQCTMRDAQDTACPFARGTAAGSEMDISAPGWEIISTCPDGLPQCRDFGQCNFSPCVCESPTGAPGYNFCSGTSMAAAMVSGAAALLWSEFPDLSPSEVRQYLLCSAKDLGSVGFDPVHGWGLLDISAAMDAADVEQCPPPGPPVITWCNGGRTGARVEWKAPPTGFGKLVGYRVYRDDVHVHSTGPDTLAFNDDGLSPGNSYIYEVSAESELGGEGPRSAPCIVESAITDEPGPIYSGSTSCSPRGAQPAPARTIVLGSPNSGRYTLYSRNHWDGTGEGPCDATIEIDTYTCEPPGECEVIPGDSYSCFASPSNPYGCVASVAFDWWRSSHGVCFTVRYRMLVDDVLLGVGQFRFCDPPLVDYLPRPGL